MSTGGIGVFIGTSRQKTTDQTQTVSHIGSTVGSLTGNVRLEAGNQLTLHGSDVVAGKDLALTAAVSVFRRRGSASVNLSMNRDKLTRCNAVCRQRCRLAGGSLAIKRDRSFHAVLSPKTRNLDLCTASHLRLNITNIQHIVQFTYIFSGNDLVSFNYVNRT